VCIINGMEEIMSQSFLEQ